MGQPTPLSFDAYQASLRRSWMASAPISVLIVISVHMHDQGLGLARRLARRHDVAS